MKYNNIKTIKNPLTIIAIFAGITEISASATLPFLDITNQSVYVWFLILFPTLLILLFFSTLNWNHRVLYAPSDFSNEDNFVGILKRPTRKEIEEKVNEEAIENEESKLKLKTKVFTNPVHTIEEEENKSTSNFPQQARLAELLVLDRLENDLGLNIEKQMKIDSGKTQLIFDGVAKGDRELIGIEVKLMKNNLTISHSRWRKLLNQYEALFHTLDNKRKMQFRVIFAIVTETDPKIILNAVKGWESESSFSIEIKVFSFDELKNRLE